MFGRSHDKAFKRWMPHINLLYPFVQVKNNDYKYQISNIGKTMEKCGVTKFSVMFSADSVGFFEHSANFNVWIKPLPCQPQVSTEQFRI